MNRRQWTFAGAAVAAVGAGAGWRLWRERGPDARPSAAVPAPALRDAALPPLPADAPAFWQQEVERLDGSHVTLATFRAPRLVVNFWATWCPPCVREMPMLDRVQRDWAAQPGGARLIGLAIDRRDAVAEFLARQPVSYPVALAGLEGSQWSRELGNDRGALPFSVVFDARGQVLNRQLGELREDQLRAWGTV